MLVASRTPDGRHSFCPICGQACCVDPADPPGDACCPHCGSLVWFDESPATDESLDMRLALIRNLATWPTGREALIREVVDGARACLEAVGAAYWRCWPDRDQLEYQNCLPGSASLLLDRLALVHRVQSTGSSLVVPPYADDGEIINPTGYQLLYAGVWSGGEIVGVLEVALWADVRENAVAVRLELLTELADIVGQSAAAVTPPTEQELLPVEAPASFLSQEFSASGVCALSIRVVVDAWEQIETQIGRVRVELDQWQAQRQRIAGLVKLDVAARPEWFPEITARLEALYDDPSLGRWLSGLTVHLSLATLQGFTAEELRLQSPRALAGEKPWWKFW